MSATILYLASYRLGMIAAGIVAILVGYRLFAIGITASAKRSEEGGESITGEFAGVKLAIVNTAPGTAFALFGVIIIGLQLIHGGPESIIDYYENGQLKKTALRGDASNETIQANHAVVSVRETSAKALGLLGQDPLAAEKTVIDLLMSLQMEMNNLAWVLAETNPRLAYAGPLGELALSLNPDDPDTLHTAAVIAYANGDRSRAIELMERASGLLTTPIDQQIEEWRDVDEQ